MIKNGVRPRKIKDHRNYSFRRTFGSLSLASLDQEVNYDAGLTMPDQNAEGLFFGCSGETTCDIATDWTGKIFLPAFTYYKTCNMEGHGPDRGCYIDNALKSATVYGLQEPGMTTDAQALVNRRGKRFEVDLVPGYDTFDSIRSALLLNPKRSISVGTPWFNEWMTVGADGLVPIPFFTGAEQWHNWKICGITRKNGAYVLIGKSWQGKKYGNAGFHYISREAINYALGIRGAELWVQAKAEPGDIQTIQLDYLQTILSYIAQLFAAFMNQPQTPPAPAPEPVPPAPTPVPPAPAPAPTFPNATLDVMCIGIRDYEGKPGELNYRNNNPGNCRYSSVGYAAIYGIVRKDANNFAIFKTYDLGMLYLHNLIKSKIKSNPSWTLLDYISNHAPRSDGNNPTAYATFVAARMGVDIYYPMSKVISS